MRFLVVGCGSIGMRHIGNLTKLGHEVMVFDREEDRMKNAMDKYGVHIADVLSNSLHFDAFIIAVPPVYHDMFAKRAIEMNAHIFVEKPISNRRDELSQWLAEAERKKLAVQVGYQLRFNNGLRLMKEYINKIGKPLFIRAEFGQYLPDWHPSEPYQMLYTSVESLGGGIILDASHELDYVRWLAGGRVIEAHCVGGHLSELENEVEDVAEIILQFDNHVVASIHVDFIQRNYVRQCKIVGDTGDIEWDYKKDSLNINYGNNTSSQIWYDKRDAYVEEMKHFINCIQTGTRPVCDGRDAEITLDIALKAKEQLKGTAYWRFLEGEPFND